MKTLSEAHDSLNTRLEGYLGNSIKEGSMLDLFSYSISGEIEDMYQEIDDARNPYLFTNIYGEDLDAVGAWTNLVRREEEDDDTYKYRLKDWVYSAEASNSTAISNILLTPEYASNIDYVPNTHGCGTGTCYIVPKSYDDDVIQNALIEAQERIQDIVSPSLYVEYIVPSIRAVRLNCFLQTEDVNTDLVKNTIEDLIREYINAIPPREFLKVGDLVRIGLNVAGVSYFNVMTILLNEEPLNELQVVQELETKFLYDTIDWSGENYVV